MAQKSVFDLNATNITLSHITIAVQKIQSLLPDHLEKHMLHDLITGFKALIILLKCKEKRVLEVTVEWAQLILKVQSSLNPKDCELQLLFEKIVPPVVTYIIGCLQIRSSNLPTYHYDLLNTTLTLLSNVKEATVENVAKFKSGAIACLWLPIDFVGDFNTQMMAVRLLVQLIKCLDPKAQQIELNKIPCSQSKLIYDRLNRTITVGNYQEGVFENTAREFLNCYNMNLAEHVLVYSFRCKTLRFGDHIEFFKLQNAEHFWVDLNYCPGTFSFTGRFKSRAQKEWTTVSVACYISGLQLQQQLLILELKPSKYFYQSLPNLAGLENVSYATLELPLEEILRLQENDFILDYYKMKVNSKNLKRIDQISKPIIESNSDSENHKSLNTTGVGNAASLLDAMRVQPTNPKNNFQRSYALIIGESDNEKHTNGCSTQSDDIISVASIENLKERCLNREKAPNTENDILQTNNDSPKTSFYVNNSKGFRKGSHPIRELNVKKRFFKATKRSWNSDLNDQFTKSSNIKCRTGDSTKKDNVFMGKFEKHIQVNKVKPMKYFDEPNIITENNNNIISNVKENPFHATTFRNSSPEYNDTPLSTNGGVLARDVYEDFDVSDAEPGQSYRNYQIRRRNLSLKKDATLKKPNINETVLAKLKADATNTNAIAKTKIAVDAIRTTRKREYTTAFAVNHTTFRESMSTTKLAQLINNAQNETVYSAEIEIDLTESSGQQNDEKELTASNITTASQAGLRSLKQQQLRLQSAEIVWKEISSNHQSNATHSSNDSENTLMSTCEIQECRKDVNISTATVLTRPGPLDQSLQREAINAASSCSPQTITADRNDFQISQINKLVNMRQSTLQDELSVHSAFKQTAIHEPGSENNSFCNCSDLEGSTSSSEIEDQPNTQLNSTWGQNKKPPTTNTPKSSFLKASKSSILPENGLAPASTSFVMHCSGYTTRDNSIATTSEALKKGSLTTSLVSPISLKKEFGDVIYAYKQQLVGRFNDLLVPKKQKCVDVFVEKVSEISTIMLKETERECADLQKLQKAVESIVRQLDWQYEVYKKNSNRFNCFQENIKGFMQALAQINVCQLVDEEFQTLFNEVYKSLRGKNVVPWGDFIKRITRSLISNISDLSDLE